MIKDNFKIVMSGFTSAGTIADFWTEIEQRYAHPGRHYHTLRHLENMLKDLIEVKQHIHDWDSTIIALVYHDIVYNPLSGSNEEASASFARKHLAQTSYPAEWLDRVESLIIATKKHQWSNDGDTNYFTDADLAILGKDLDEYEEYASNVRKEYSIVPDLIYKPGRIKVLKHFLAMETIYKTAFFRDAYEDNARINIQHELTVLSE